MIDRFPSYKWWQTAVFYQIYPRSFADGNGDGIGDLAGIRSRLDYLKDLGIDALWLSPHYPSPMCDCGYDVSDYEDIAPEYGTLEEFRLLLDESHQRGIKLILDLVLNHTSDQHRWFQESRSSLTNPKRDWYIWKKGNNGNPPNNWSSTFGGSAWELDPITNEYYYHFFFKGQPDLNWKNPEVKTAMFDMVRFWLKMGVDGFRLDAVGTVFEEEGWKDTAVPMTIDELYPLAKAAKTPAEARKADRTWTKLFQKQVDQPEIHSLMKELRQVVDEFDDRVLVGETDDVRFYGNGEDELHLVFNFPLKYTSRITPAWVRNNQKHRLNAMPQKSWAANTLGNHDSYRMLTQFGDGKHDRELAEVNLAMLLFLKGTPFLYNGEEIGMTNYYFDDVNQFRDPLSNYIYGLETRLLQTSAQEAALIAARKGRDLCRTPMQWKNAPHGGFCPADVSPWLPVNPDFANGINVAEQEDQPSLLLSVYKHLLSIRKQTPALMIGEYSPLLPASRSILAFTRTSPQQNCLVLINFTPKPRKVFLEEITRFSQMIFSNQPASAHPDENGNMRLASFEIWIGELKGN
ncbi:MAG: alpha-glucosidase [Anaerolineaceae bacterium]